jgi:hypothetical protein
MRISVSGMPEQSARIIALIPPLSYGPGSCRKRFYLCKRANSRYQLRVNFTGEEEIGLQGQILPAGRKFSPALEVCREVLAYTDGGEKRTPVTILLGHAGLTLLGRSVPARPSTSPPRLVVA